jgi:excisionase family DNA binding protein
MKYRIGGDLVSDTRLTVPQIAQQLNVSERAVHNWIDAGKLVAEEEYHGRQRRRFVRLEAYQTFVATLPNPPDQPVG